MVSTSHRRRRRQKGVLDSSIFPFSILDISNTSSIRFKRWLLDMDIFFRQSFTRPGSFTWARAMEVIPTMAFMGVRISWDIWARKLLFASFAYWAASYAAIRAFRFSSSCFISIIFWSWMFMFAKITLATRLPSISATLKRDLTHWTPSGYCLLKSMSYTG